MDQRKDNSTMFLWATLVALFIFLLDQVGFLDWYKNIHSFISAPIQYSQVTFTSGIQNSLTSLFYTSTLKKENADLKTRILELEKLTADQTAIIETNQATAETRAILGQLPYKESVVAYIIDATHTDIAGYLKINKGSTDGISVGLPVVVKDYYVGYVDSVTKNTATVKSLEIAGQSFIGYIEKRKISATVKTEIGKVYLDDLLANETLQLLDLVSIKREQLPYSFPVGTITTIPKETGTAERIGTITPFIRTADISLVTVVIE